MLENHKVNQEDIHTHYHEKNQEDIQDDYDENLHHKTNFDILPKNYYEQCEKTIVLGLINDRFFPD